MGSGGASVARNELISGVFSQVQARESRLRMKHPWKWY
jgi:hypothetical protein